VALARGAAPTGAGRRRRGLCELQRDEAPAGLRAPRLEEGKAADTSLWVSPTLSPARGPPFFKSVVIRRKLGEPVQAELFDAH
jgi:hypothetical protein